MSLHRPALALLVAAASVASACGNGQGSRPWGAAAPAGDEDATSGGGAGGVGSSSGTTSPGAVGPDGAAAACPWAGTTWSCAGGIGQGGGSSSGSSSSSSSGGTNPDASSTAADAGGGAPVDAAPRLVASDASVVVPPIAGPAITVTEFLIPTPSDPGAITAGPDGNVWFTHESTAPDAIGRVSTSGTNFGLFMTQTTNTGPVAIVGGSDGNIWFTKQNGIARVTPAGTVTEYGLPNGGDSAGLAAGPDGNLWLTEPIHNKVVRATTSVMFTEYAVPSASSSPFAIAVGPDKNLWFTESSAAANNIGVVTTSGKFTEFPIPTPSSNSRGITGGPDGNVWFTELDGHKVGRITPSGAIVEFVIPSLGSPSSITAGPDGNLWFTEPGNVNAIGRITPSGGISEYVIPTALSDPDGIAVGPDKNVWFCELSANKIGRISNLTGGGNLQSSMPTASAPPPGSATTCTTDADCIAGGKACGGDVCSHTMTPAVCVSASTGDPGYCTANANCWCAGQGATCNTTTRACSITLYGGM